MRQCVLVQHSCYYLLDIFVQFVMMLAAALVEVVADDDQEAVAPARVLTSLVVLCS